MRDTIDSSRCLNADSQVQVQLAIGHCVTVIEACHGVTRDTIPILGKALLLFLYATFIDLYFLKLCPYTAPDIQNGQQVCIQALDHAEYDSYILSCSAPKTSWADDVDEDGKHPCVYLPDSLHPYICLTRVPQG